MSAILPAKIDKIIGLLGLLISLTTSIACEDVKIAVIFKGTPSLAKSFITGIVETPFVLVIGIFT